MYDFRREGRFEITHPTYEIIGFNTVFLSKHTGLTRSSTASADEDDLLGFIDFAHAHREYMEGDIASFRDMDFSIFACSSDIDEVDFFW